MRADGRVNAALRRRIAGAGVGSLLATLAGVFVAAVLATSAVAQPGVPGPDYWLLTEFDWGDDPEVVVDSVMVAPGYVCFQSGGQCRFFRVRVDGEDLLARFEYRDERLWQIAFVTPGLSRVDAQEHMPRVLETLSGYIERFKGPPLVAAGLPDFAALSDGSATPTRFWKLPDMEIRIEVARKGREFFLGAFFYDPSARETD
jgi:hypothetical protein